MMELIQIIIDCIRMELIYSILYTDCVVCILHSLNYTLY